MTAASFFRWATRLFFIVVLLLGASVLWWRHQLWTPTISPESTLEIKQGASSTSILRQLQQAALLPSIPAGRLYLEGPARGREMQWGTYVVPAQSRPVDVIDMLLQGRVKPIHLTVIEGMSSGEIKAVLDAAGITDTESWPTLVANTTLISDLAPDAPSLEGFLFPETYTFSSGVDPATVVRTMISRFRRVFSEELSTSDQPSLPTLDVVTLASLIEAETAVPEERRRVAGVFVNRLQRGMLLQCDPTVVYSLRRRGEWTGRLLRVHWTVDDPYNTYRYPGLPPGPINNPGRAALQAALDPEKHNLLYFVADDSGGHTFSSTLKQHNRAVAQRKRSRH